MFSDAAGAIPALTSDTTNGSAFTVDVNLDGTTTATNSSVETTISRVSAVPEPSSLMLLGAGLAAIALGTFLRRRKCVCD